MEQPISLTTRETAAPSFAGVTGTAAETVGQPITYSPEEAQAYGPVAETIGEKIGAGAEKVKETGKTLGEELTERRHHEKPLTPGDVIENVKAGAISAYEKTGEAITRGAERFHKATLLEDPEQYHKRVREATTGGERQAADVAEANAAWQKKWQMRRTPEEQSQLVSEVGEHLYDAGKKTPIAVKEGAKRLISGTSQMPLEEQPFGGFTEYEGTEEPGESYLEKAGVAFEKEVPRYINQNVPDLGLLYGLQRANEAIEHVDKSGVPERIIIREPHEMPDAGLDVYQRPKTARETAEEIYDAAHRMRE
jgi:hypothetical protein